MLVFESQLLLLYRFALIQCKSLRSNQSILHLNTLRVHVLILTAPGQIELTNSINKHTLFHLLIQGTVSHKTRRLINLNQLRFGLLVQEYVESQDLHTKITLQILRLSRPVNMRYLAVTRNDSLNG